MPIPEGFKAIDAWVNFNPAEAYLSHPIRQYLRDKESLDPILSPLNYLFPGTTDRERTGATPT